MHTNSDINKRGKVDKREKRPKRTFFFIKQGNQVTNDRKTSFVRTERAEFSVLLHPKNKNSQEKGLTNGILPSGCKCEKNSTFTSTEHVLMGF